MVVYALWLHFLFLTAPFMRLHRLLSTVFLLRLILALGLLSAALPSLAAPAHRQGIRVVMDDNYPPYTFRDSQGRPQGYLVDLWQLWQKKTGIPVKLVSTDWSKAQALMADGQAEVIDTIFRTAEREKLLDFSAPYAQIPVSIFTNAGITGVTSTDDLRGFLVGTKAGDACIEKLEEGGIPNIQSFDNYEKLVQAAVDDQVKVFCLDDAPAEYFLYRLSSHDAFHKAFQLYSGEFHRAVHKGDGATLALVEDGFKQITPQEYKTLHDKWLGNDFLPFPWIRSLLAVLLVALALGLALLLWTASLRRQVRRHTRDLAYEQSRLNALIDTIPDLIWLKDINGVYLSCNQEFEKFFGATEAQIKGKRDHDFVDAELADFFLQKDREAMAAGASSRNEEWVTYQSDGRRVLLETIKTPMKDASGKVIGVLGIARDITALHNNEQQLRRINRAQRLLSDSTHAMMRQDEEQGLLESVCRIAVEAAGYTMAWVGMARQDEAQRVEVVAHAGHNSDYLKDLNISWGDNDLGQGPTGKAIRQGTPIVNQNFLTNPAVAPWREAALAHGFQSSIALPLIMDQQVVGALTIYAVEPDAFQSEEVALLEKLTEDLAFGLHALRLRLGRDKAVAALKESEFLVRSQFDLGNIGIAITSPDKGWLRVNPRLCHMLGYPEADLKQTTWAALTHPDDLPMDVAYFNRLMAGDIDSYEMDKRFIRKNGKVLYTHLTVSCFRDQGEVTLIIASILDITERHRNEEKLALAAQVFENTVEGVLITDAQSQIVTVNKAFTTITGYTEDEVRGRNPSLLKSEHQDESFYQAMWQALLRDGFWQGELWNRRKNGETYPQWLTISAVRAQNGAVTHYVAVFNDISAIKASEERLNYLAYHDALTGLPNRVLFHDRLEHSIARARRDGRMIAILYLDLDHFKHINDTLGHHVGDEVLRQIAIRLAANSRAGDTIARLGGDEFVVILENEASPRTAAVVAHKIASVFATPLKVNEREMFVTPSIGISIFPSDGADAATLLQQADLAMYKAKEQGRNTFQFYESTLSAQAIERMTLENALRGALQRREFFVHYQPQVSLHDGRLLGAEALLRWHHPELGLVSPGRFIPVAEDMGIIGEIGAWVLEESCRQFATWRDAGLDMPRLAVNLSVQQLERQALVEQVSSLLRQWQIPAAQLELEVTESMLMDHTGHAAETLEGLRQLGVYLAVDDFGTGYSSFTYLRRLPIHRLKVDYSFVKDIGRDRNSENIVKAVIALAQSLELELVAEGVEREDQAVFLRQAGCEIAQGYLYSRPVAPEEITEHWRR